MPKTTEQKVADLEQWAAALSTWFTEKTNKKKAHDWITEADQRISNLEPVGQKTGTVPPPPPPPTYPK